MKNRVLLAAPGRRNVRLAEETFDPAAPPAPGRAIVCNLISMIYPGYDLSRIAETEETGEERPLGRVAIGSVRASAIPGLDAGSRIFWNGPHADFAEFDPARHISLSIPSRAVSEEILPLAVAAEAERGIDLALAPAGAATPERAIVVGQGLLGHLAGQTLRLRGCAVTVVENAPKRLEFSKYLGLVQRLDTHNLNWRERLEKWNPGGAPLLIDASGGMNTVEACVAGLAPGGTFLMLGPWRPPLPDAIRERLAEKGARVVGPPPFFGDAPEHRDLLARWIERLANGEIATDRLMTGGCAPEDAPLEAKRLATGVKSMLGVAIRWEEGRSEGCR